jgi:putative transposase
MAEAVRRAYKYRFYPSPGQEPELLRTFGCVRKVWNLALDARTEAWYQRQERVTTPSRPRCSPNGRKQASSPT